MNLVFRAAWFDAWWPETDTEHAIIVEDDLVGHNCIALQLPVQFVQIAIPVQIVQLVTIPVQIVQHVTIAICMQFVHFAMSFSFHLVNISLMK